MGGAPDAKALLSASSRPLTKPCDLISLGWIRGAYRAEDRRYRVTTQCEPQSKTTVEEVTDKLESWKQCPFSSPALSDTTEILPSPTSKSRHLKADMKPSSSTRRALILVDLQNEFLDPEKGNFPILESARVGLLDRLKVLVPAFRDGDMLGDEHRSTVIWVRAEYSAGNDSKQGEEEGCGDEESDPKDHFLSGTHTGKTPCCVPGSHGARIHPEMEALIMASVDHMVTKTRFSSFANTGLGEYVVKREIREVWVAGLLSSVCVLATLVDGLKSLPDVRFGVVEDCLGYIREKSHQRALERMRGMRGMRGMRMGDSDDKRTGDENMVRFIQSAQFTKPKLYYVNGSIPSWRVMIALNEKGIPFDAIRMRVMTRPKPTRTPEFLNLNERGKTPVFIDYALPSNSGDGNSILDRTRTIVNESIAILQYIEDYYPAEQPLLPPLRDRVLRAEVLSLIQESENIHWIYDDLEDAFFEAKSGDTENSRVKRWTEFVENIRPELIRKVEEELQHWEVYLGGTIDGQQGGGLRAVRRAQRTGPFLAGTEYMTLADCAFYPILAYMEHRGFRVDGVDGEGTTKWPALEKYMRFIEESKSVRMAVPEGWEKRGKTNIFRGTN